MKRNKHSVFEIVHEIIRNFFNEDDEVARKAFQRLISEPGLLNNAAELKSKEQLLAWLSEPSRFSSRNAYNKFHLYVKQKRRIRTLRNIRIAASVAILMAIGCAIYQLNDTFKQTESTIIAKQTTAQTYIITEDGSIVNLEPNKQLVQDIEGAKIIQDSTGVKYTLTDNKTESKITYNELNVPRGGEYKVELTDGTTIWVNADSRLKYPVRFQGNSREIYLLSGEAYFKVAKNPSKPFYVHTSQGCVKVLGTEFNVRAYPEEYQVVTTLVNGSIQFSEQKVSGKQTILQPGEQIIVDFEQQQWDVRKVNLEEYVSWRNGVYVFNHITLEKLMKIIERNYNVSVFYANEECKQLVFSGDLKKYDNIEDALRFIETGGDIKFTIKEHVITVYKE